jgi:hypothetical protein
MTDNATAGSKDSKVAQPPIKLKPTGAADLKDVEKWVDATKHQKEMTAFPDPKKFPDPKSLKSTNRSITAGPLEGMSFIVPPSGSIVWNIPAQSARTDSETLTTLCSPWPSTLPPSWTHASRFHSMYRSFITCTSFHLFLHIRFLIYNRHVA